MGIDCGWAQHIPLSEHGIIAGCTQSQEWLLPWWWMNMRLHNNYPVTFVNFGDMSPTALNWCQQRGSVVTLNLPADFVAPKEKIEPRLASTWESMHAYVWQMRLAWFKKPFALLQSPYAKALWLDVDCQVCGPLQPIFDKCADSDLAMKKEEAIFHRTDVARGLLLPDEKVYNAGVIAFRHGAPIVHTWAQQAVEQNHLFIGDQQLLARILHTHNYPIAVLPEIYNWRGDLGRNPNAVILHWVGSYKAHIQKQIDILRHLNIDLCLH